MKMTNALLCACGLALVSAPAAWAQGPDEPARGFVTAGGGFRYLNKSTNEGGTFTLYDETGSYGAPRKVTNAPFFDVGAGLHVTGKISAGVVVTHFAKGEEVPYAVVVPHPLFVNEPRTVGMNVKDMSHSETAIHVQAIYQLLSSGRYEANVFAGPSIFLVKEDVVESVTATESSSPYTAVNLDATFGSASKTAVGGHVGMDINYRLVSNLGVGFTVRYAVGTAKLPTGTGTRSVTLGGPQVGFGLRYRF